MSPRRTHTPDLFLHDCACALERDASDDYVRGRVLGQRITPTSPQAPSLPQHATSSSTPLRARD